MPFNVDDAIKNQERLINVGNNKIENVRTFKYLGYTITNNEEKTSCFLHARIGAAFQKWNERKHVLTDRRIRLSTRVRFLTKCVRSRLLYNIPTWSLTEKELDTTDKNRQGMMDKDLEGRYEISNEKL